MSNNSDGRPMADRNGEQFPASSANTDKLFIDVRNTVVIELHLFFDESGGVQIFCIARCWSLSLSLWMVPVVNRKIGIGIEGGEGQR